MLFRKTHPALHAIILTLFGFSSFSLADTGSKWLIQSYSVHQVLVLSSMIGLSYTGIWTMTRYNGLEGFKSDYMTFHLWRGLTVAGIALFVVNALLYIPLADFYSIIFLAPLVVVILSAIFLKERVGLPRILSVAVGFVGVLIVAGPKFAAANIGVLFVLGAMLCVSVSSILVRKIGPDEKLPLYAFYPSLFIFLTNLPFAVQDFHWPGMADLALFILHGILVLIGQFGTALGFARATETALVAPFHYVQILWGVLFGYILFHDVPTFTTLIGSSIIIGSGLFVIYREHRLKIGPKMPEAQV